MKKPVGKAPVKRKGFADGGLVPPKDLSPRAQQLWLDYRTKKYDVDELADKHRQSRLPWTERNDQVRPKREDPRDPMIVSGTAGTTRDRREMDMPPENTYPPFEVGLAKGGKVKKTIPVKRKRR